MGWPSIPRLLRASLLLGAMVLAGCDSDDDSSRLSQGVGSGAELPDDAPEEGTPEEAPEDHSDANVAACEEFEDELNALYCVNAELDVCEGASDVTDCDISDYYECIDDAYDCESTYYYDGLVVDEELLEACAPLAACP